MITDSELKHALSLANGDMKLAYQILEFVAKNISVRIECPRCGEINPEFITEYSGNADSPNIKYIICNHCREHLAMLNNNSKKLFGE